tara:strand:+ start:132 stop:254 length:123 start_codon:yes stop_codon:yes gene_type:complete
MQAQEVLKSNIFKSNYNQNKEAHATQDEIESLQTVNALAV